jgi:hypothetical protein
MISEVSDALLEEYEIRDVSASVIIRLTVA